MSKKEKKKNEIKKCETIVESQNISTIVSEDKNKISDVTTEVKKNIDNVAYEDINDNSITSTEKKEEKTAECENIKNISSTTENQLNEENALVTKKSHKTLLIISFSIFAIFLLLFIFSTVFALITSYKTTIIHGIKIKDIDVSGLTKEEAILKVSSAFKEKLGKQITLKHNDYSITVFPEQFDVSFKIEEAVNMAYSKGRTRKRFSKQL